MPAHRGAALQLDRVVKTYGSGQVAVHALRGVDLEVGAGEFVVVLGPADRQDNRQV
jgi:putative ABC transport system ATP-binding protein